MGWWSRRSSFPLPGQSNDDKKLRMLTDTHCGCCSDTLMFHDSSLGCPRASMPPKVGFLVALTSLWMDATATGPAGAGR